MSYIKTIVVVLALAGIVFTSCEELMDFGVNIDTGYHSVPFVVYPTDEIGDAVFSTSEVGTSLDSLLSGTTVTRDNISSIKLKEAVIKLTNAQPDITFDYFTWLEATIEVDGMEEIVIAKVDSVPKGVKNITCDIIPAELLPYVEGNGYTLRARGASLSAINDTLYIEGKLKFSVTTSVAETFE